MKIRKGFVSNSSSSSFVCDITGASESGYDARAEDCGMVEFDCGHVILDRYFNDGDYHIWVSKQQEADEEFDEDVFYDGKPHAFCPICSGKEMSRDDYIAYALKHVLTKKDYLAIVKSFPSYADFQAALK